jgi:outer membrane protein assembly factor BamA
MIERRERAWTGPTRVVAVVVVLCALSPAPANADPGIDADPLPDDAALEAAGAVIGAIEVRNVDIFDTSLPEEDRWAFRAANKLHVKTREKTIRALVLFGPGDPYRRAVLDESERILRDQRYLYDADIRVVRVNDGAVDVVIETRDVWTLKPTLNFKRAGGENSYQLGIEEDNFLGFGKSLAFRHQKDVDRTTTLFRYRDPNLRGSHGRLEVAYSDNSDGVSKGASISRPFYALDVRWAGGAVGLEDDRVETLYSNGDPTDRFRHQRDYLEFRSGWSDGLVDGVVRRWTAGYTYDDNRFSDALGEEPSTRLPDDRTLAYPWVEWQRIHADFVETRNLDSVARTEDVDLGRTFRVRAGWIDTAFGADRDQLLLSGAYQDAAVPRSGHLLLWRFDATGRIGGPDGTENGLLSGEFRWDVTNFARHRFHVGIRGDAAENLDGDLQLVLGGEEGLRGYPIRYMDGDRRVLLTVEQRFYTDLHLFRLVRVGGAVFADVGRAWYVSDPGQVNRGWQRDLGIGLRLGSSRSASASMVHLDLAFPLDGDPSIDSVQFLVETREKF